MDKLIINNLTVEIENKMILKDFNLEINSGEIHVIMGPNGTGKSTLSKTIMGDKNYKIIGGEIKLNDEVLNDLTTDQIARLKIFLSMQMPIEIEGVSNADFLRTAVSLQQDKDFKLFKFIKECERNLENLNFNKEMLYRSVNVGFSGGERKKNEILQMNLLKPRVVLLDEIDSGLDVDSLKIVGEKVMEYFEEEKPAILLITHYQRLLDYIKPHYVHIMKDGKIVKSGNRSLVKEIEEKGYENLSNTSTSIIEEKV